MIDPAWQAEFDQVCRARDVAWARIVAAVRFSDVEALREARDRFREASEVWARMLGLPNVDR